MLKLSYLWIYTSAQVLRYYHPLTYTCSNNVVTSNGYPLKLTIWGNNSIHALTVLQTCFMVCTRWVPAFNCLPTLVIIKLLFKRFFSFPPYFIYFFSILQTRMAAAILLYCFSKWQKYYVKIAATKCRFHCKSFKMWENIINQSFSEKYSRANLAGECDKWKVNHFSAAVLNRSKRITTVPIVGGYGSDIISNIHITIRKQSLLFIYFFIFVFLSHHVFICIVPKRGPHGGLVLPNGSPSQNKEFTHLYWFPPLSRYLWFSPN